MSADATATDEAPIWDPDSWATPPLVCTVIDSGRLAERDVLALRAFTEFLAKAGPVRRDETGRRIPGTPEQEAWRQRALRDPNWREFLGLPPLEPSQAATPA